MAKKKVSHAHNDKTSHKHEDSLVNSHSMDSPPSSVDSEKLEALKSLNQILLKEAVERRQQVDSLLLSKASLETELTRSNSVNEGLSSELAQLVERAAELELERSVVSVFVAAQIGVKWEDSDRKMKCLEIEMRKTKRDVEERESEIVRLNGTLGEIEGALSEERAASRRVSAERDDYRDKLKQQIEEDAGLRANQTELGDKMREIEREIEDSRSAYNTVLREKEDMAMMVESLMGQKDLTERSLMVSKELIEKMKEEISIVVREKELIEKEKNGEMVKKQELENVVSGLKEMVAKLQNEESKLQKIVAELDKKCMDSEMKLNEMGREIHRLVEEMKLGEKRIELLVHEKSEIEKGLGEVLENLAKQKREANDLANENIEILEAKTRAEGEVGELQNRVEELKAAVLEMEELKMADVEKIKSLESKVGNYKSKLEKVYVERDGVVGDLDQAKHNAATLKEKIEELEKRIHESNKAAMEVKAEKAALLSEKVEIERQCEMLKEKIASVQDVVVKSQAEIDSMKSKVELSEANSELVLNMLKGTSAFCIKDECDGEVGNMHGDGEMLKLHVMEMEAIKSSFKSKAVQVEEMKREVEQLQSCLVDEQKKKSFWSVLSSATTVLAVASLAYIARGH